MIFDQYVDELPEETRELMLAIHQLLLGLHPAMTSGMAYALPFYYLKKRVFYQLPVANGIDLGFCGGASLEDIHGIMEVRERNTVRSVRVQSVADLRDPRLMDMLMLAVENVL